MANNKMLIDASHPEETRVVVVRGNRIEEFDFEAQDRRQLRGNIYLAKVTRVEPSLQAAFIDYGGNRHGFLAFSEIHPDYYQIPAADRQALLDAEAEAASVADDDNGVGIEEAASSGNEDDEDDDAPKKRRRKSRRGGRGRKSKEEREAASDNDNSDDPESDDEKKQSDEKAEVDNKSDDGEAAVAAEADSEETPKPKKRARRPRKKKAETSDSEAAETASDGKDATDAPDAESGEDSGSSTMAAMMDMDVISEDAPDEEPSEEASSDGEASEEPAAEKPKRKPRARKSTEKADKEAETEDTVAADVPEETASVEAAEEKPKKRTRRKAPARKKAETKEDGETAEAGEEAEKPETSADAENAGAEADEKPKKRRSRRKSKSEKDEADSKSKENGDEDETDENGKSFESVGQEDALEEVSVRRPRRQYKIQEVIRRRQVMLVQVVKEERGNKGAALTTYLSLAGRYSVLMPNTARGGGISRKITNPADRKRLKEIAGSLDVPAGMGVILRTAGAAQDKEEIQRDFDYLMRLWENVRDLTLESSAPFLVYEEGSLIKRSIRDLYNKDIGEVIVAGEEGYREAKDFMRMLMPGHGRNVKLYKGEQSLLSKYNVESQLDKMVTPQVTLKSGGYLIINQTEALVAIDVNSGKSTREHSIEATALQTNMEAAEEVARQLRLRDLAGLVVIDFIDMEEKRNNRSVERKLKECLKNDRARIQVGHISHFGLLEMSRQRIRASVLESTMAVCPHCHGTGHVRSEPSFALQIVRAIDDHLNRNSRNDVVVKIPPSVAIYILNQKRAAVSELEDRYGVSIEFVSDHTIEGQDFAIERGEPATRKPRRKEAVNPMDSVDESESEAPASPNDDGGEDERGGKRQRGRGRGRGRGRDRDRSNEEQSADNASEAVSDDVVDESETQADDKTEAEAKPAKRGRGRGRKASADKAEDAAQEAKSKPAAEPEPALADEEPKEPRRRTGRPGKKVRTPEEIAEANAAKTADAPAENGERKGAPPREVKRRNTRRVKKTDADNKTGEPESFNDGFLG